MTEFYISCKESKIENNRSFYGCFSCGPFDSGQSITVANALRRTLLSELKGLAIGSVEIDGVMHEYSSMPGIRDSVLDILLNLKEIVLKKNCSHFKPQIGYLRVKGPGVVKAKDLRLPPFIQCVDPDQYIATLADDGLLNFKIFIEEGKSYKIQTPKIQRNFNELKRRRLLIEKLKQIAFSSEFIENCLPFGSKQPKVAKQPCSFPYVKRPILFLKNTEKKRPSFSLKNKNLIKKVNLFFKKDISDKEGLRTRNEKKNLLNVSRTGGSARIGFSNQFPKQNNQRNLEKQITFGESPYSPKVNNEAVGGSASGLSFSFRTENNSKVLRIDSVFSPVNKVNYVIENNEYKTVESAFRKANLVTDLLNLLKNAKNHPTVLTSEYEKLAKPLYAKTYSKSNKIEYSLSNRPGEASSSRLQSRLDFVGRLKLEADSKSFDNKAVIKNLISGSETREGITSAFAEYLQSKCSVVFDSKKQMIFSNAELSKKLNPVNQINQETRLKKLFQSSLNNLKKEEELFIWKNIKEEAIFNFVKLKHKNFAYLSKVNSGAADRAATGQQSRLDFADGGCAPDSKKQLVALEKTNIRLRLKKAIDDNLSTLSSKKNVLSGEFLKKLSNNTADLLNLKNEFENVQIHTTNRALSLTRSPSEKRSSSFNTARSEQTIILEIWTNGSIHPREALYEAFKNLISLFSQLKKIKILAPIFNSERNYSYLIQKIKEEKIPASNSSLLL